MFKVPPYLRDANPQAFTPKFVSIGPLHRGQAHLASTQKYKWAILRCILDRKGGKDIKFYVDAIAEHKNTARRCYVLENDEISDGDFMEMLVLDSFFIIELLLAFAHGHASLGYPAEEEPIFLAPEFDRRIKPDFLLLENQIPLFVLKRLFEMVAEPGDSLERLAASFFQPLFPSSKLGIPNPREELDLHLLGLIRTCLLSSDDSLQAKSFPMNLRSKYFYHPWIPISFVAIIVGICLKFLFFTS
ncbi:hypothetical protein ACLOJK_020726 [Asimina triloba]